MPSAAPSDRRPRRVTVPACWSGETKWRRLEPCAGRLAVHPRRLRWLRPLRALPRDKLVQKKPAGKGGRLALRGNKAHWYLYNCQARILFRMSPRSRIRLGATVRNRGNRLDDRRARRGERGMPRVGDIHHDATAEGRKVP
jgi:hypothetical protein